MQPIPNPPEKPKAASHKHHKKAMAAHAMKPADAPDKAGAEKAPPAKK